MSDTLRRLGNSELQVVPLERSAFVRPQSILFQLDGGHTHPASRLLSEGHAVLA